VRLSILQHLTNPGISRLTSVIRGIDPWIDLRNSNSGILNLCIGPTLFNLPY